ncbi:hypothetical protein AB0C04_20800 [Micromonospora sp. NPDC048909]|uniref:hypothetical protein n=1 Tax=Micromonospora sp. NPDC048909 TaxID=3155643 RepID=UPI0033E7278A
MSEHTPQHHQDPARPVDPHSVDPTLIDLVAGDPPVPVTVWRTARIPTDAGRSVGGRLAYRLVAAYSRPGEVVVDLTGDHALAAVCAAGGRRHHPGWFTDASSLIIAASTPSPRPDPTALPDDDSDLPDMRVWFGDDLTDPDPDLPADSATPAREGTPPQPPTSLVVACWPLDLADATNRVRLAWLLSACARVLRPGGCLVLIVIAASAVEPEDFTPIATAAAAVGLGYLQHIVAVAADTDADTFVYHVSDEELLTLAQQASEQQWAVAHLRVHADVLVFSAAPPPSTARRQREGGDHRG